MRRLRPLATIPAVLVLLLAGCGSEGGDDAAEGSSPAATPEPSTDSSEDAGEERKDRRERRERDRPSQEAAPEPDLAVTVAGGEITPNAEELQVAVGEPMTVRVESDRVGELHVHSTPEQYVEFGPGTTTRELVFETPGSIEVEEHDSGAVVAFVEAR